MKLYKLWVAAVIIFFTTVYAQYEVEFNTVEGKLGKSDKYQKNFGRYDGYEIELYEGEGINFIVHSKEFLPRLVLANQAGVIFKEAVPNKSNIASVSTIIPESGEWIVYVVGDSLSEGDYTLQMAIASKNSVTLNSNSDFCNTLNFLLAHSKAYFLLLDAPLKKEQTFVKLTGSKDAFIDEKDGSYVAKFYEGNSIEEAQKVFKDVTNNIKTCLNKNWELRSKEWQQFEDFRIKGNLIMEKESDITRYIQISLIDLRKSKQRFIYDYVVQVEINRKN